MEAERQALALATPSQLKWHSNLKHPHQTLGSTLHSTPTTLGLISGRPTNVWAWRSSPQCRLVSTAVPSQLRCPAPSLTKAL